MRKERFLIVLLAAGLFYLTPDALADWSATQRLTSNPGYSIYPDIAVDSANGIHVVWADNTRGNYEIYYRGNTDGGTTWNPIRRLTWNSGYSGDPAIAIDTKDTIHVVWHDDATGDLEVYYMRSLNRGKDWSWPRRLSWKSKDSGVPAIAIDSALGIHVVWADLAPGNNEIFYIKSLNGGATWSKVKRLTWTSGSSLYPAITTDPSNYIYVVWNEFIPGNPEVFHRRSATGGVTWTGAINLSSSGGGSLSPDIAAGSARAVHVVWEDNKHGGSGEIFHRRSSNRGITWTVAKRLTWTIGRSSRPAIAADSADSVHVVWEDVTSGLAEVHYKRSTNASSTWSLGERLTWSPGDSLTPALTTDSNKNIHVVWAGEYPGNYEIFYKKNSH